MAHETRTPEDFPPEVHASLKALQQVAMAAKSRHDPQLRWGTPDEIALSDLLRLPKHCTAHSGRTGLACRGNAVVGGNVCRKHGANVTNVKAARERRLLRMADPVLAEMFELATRSAIPLVRQKAAADLLDRAGVGAVVEAKVRQSFGHGAGGGVTVQIGFLTTPAAPPALGEAAHGEEEGQVIEGALAAPVRKVD